MAANKFATMLHRNTHRISVILIYAVLEWILILLLLLNSLFSYLIAKFAEYFGLKPPCPWCSRVNNFFDPAKKDTSYRDLICEVHAAEISKLGFCSNHKKLAEAHDMCEDCSPSEPNSNGSFDFFSWVEEMGKISNDGKKKKIENGEKSSRCSCCKVSLNTKLYTPYWLFKPSWEVLDYIKKGNPIVEASNDNSDEVPYSDPRKSVSLTDQNSNVSEIRESKEDVEDEEEEETWVAEEHEILSDVDECIQVKDEEECLESPSGHQFEERLKIDGEEEPLEEDDLKLLSKGRSTHRSSKGIMTKLCSPDNVSLEMLPAHLEKWSDHDDHFLITIESIDSLALEKQDTLGHRKAKNEHDGKFISESQIEGLVELADDASIVLELGTEEFSVKNESNKTFTELNSKSEDEVDNASAMLTEVSNSKLPCNGDIVEATEAATKHSNEPPATEENTVEESIGKAKSEKFIRRETSDQGLTDQPQVRDPIPSLHCLEDHTLNCCNDARNSTNYVTLLTENHQGAMEAGKPIIEANAMLDETIKHGVNHHSSICPELDNVDKEKIHEMPDMESLTNPHKKFLLFEKKESGAEEFKCGNAVTDIEGGDRILTIEHLKSALVAERKVLNALNAELAAERSAAAIAANQTMVMMTKLQEEKASMQMEALQYQRMMEEQSEYDQEALKLLNELMVKREKEKQEIEKELEIYRKKVYHYEEKEKLILRRKSSIGRSTTSSASCNSEDSDGFTDRQESGKQDTPADTVQNLEDTGGESLRHLSTLNESLADFEVERMAILEQLKALEEKLFTLDDDDEGAFFEDIQPIENFSGKTTSKGFNENYEFHSAEANGFVNGFCVDGEDCQEKINVSNNPKRLLPLFDKIGMENEDEILKEEQQGSISLVHQNSSNSQCTPYNKKLAIEEEVDHVYQRLQALEADREFLKHSVISLKKGDKGMDLLEEILQHLRDLKSVELRARNMSNATLL